MVLPRRISLPSQADSLYIVRGLLKSLSIKQGIKYDSPESAREIPTFIEFYKLNVAEILNPLSSFSRSRCDSHRAPLCDPLLLETFNEFYYRLGSVPYSLLVLTGFGCFFQGN
jgi:hypothetical protein